VPLRQWIGRTGALTIALLLMAIIVTGPARAEQQSAAIQMSASPQGLWVIFGLGVFGEFQGKSLKKSG
jgi:hypothetical protein